MADNKENGAGAGNRREEHTAGIAAMDETFSGADGQQERGGKPVSIDTHAVDHLVVTFARAYQMLSTYCCRACIHELQSQLPEQHFRSALVSQWVGKAYYEMNEYKSAMLAFREMLRVEPFRLCGLETLSTALWHLKRDKELCALAQQVVEVDKLAPESWCVVGNCFSLQKEPDTAIRFFQRALQLDPAFTYAHTLCGHEQVNNEDLEKAVESFRAAILHCDRHYNAWYGLGSIYFRQEKYELAEYHFRRALGINPASSVLHCYLGACGASLTFLLKCLRLLRVLLLSVYLRYGTARTGQPGEELGGAGGAHPGRRARRGQSAGALLLDLHDAPAPCFSSPYLLCYLLSVPLQLHFQRASILVALDCLPEALAALLVVEEHAPKEPPVHALLGQVYHRLGELQLAIRHLNIAMDLDPKESASLKVNHHVSSSVMASACTNYYLFCRTYWNTSMTRRRKRIKVACACISIN
jgi:tetratricopeptide (TPR) repeat protein